MCITDATVHGCTEQEHGARLHHMMEVTRELGLVFIKVKCTMKVSSNKFFGCIYNTDGVHPDPEKVAIHNMAYPRNVTSLQELL